MLKTVVRDVVFYEYKIGRFENGELTDVKTERRLEKMQARAISNLAKKGVVIVGLNEVVERREMSLEKFVENSDVCTKPKRKYNKRSMNYV